MSAGPDPQWRRVRHETRRREVARRRRRALAAGCVAVAILAVVVVIALADGGASSTSSGPTKRSASALATSATRRPASAATSRHGTGANGGAGGGTSARRPGEARAPILMYHVINSPPAGAPFPGLYVTPEEFAEQMRALARAGYRAVTQDQLWASWHEGAPLPAGKPIVLSFDNGYQSQYTQALPVLRRLGWVGVENIQLTGLPPSQGGLSEAQVRGLVRAGWELDTQGISHADLTTLDAAALHAQVASARGTIQRRYGVPVNWFCYPSGQYDATVLAAVRAAGYRGSTTVVPGWAQPEEDPYRLPRLRVLGGTSGATLVSEIAAIRGEAPPPVAYVTN
ncbi:MAG TPA: polysaccharide deacetylase family protein [Solirubrobacteraceae bacterium]